MCKSLVAFCVAAALVSGCGYQLLGAGGTRPASLWVGPVADESNEPLFGAHVRAALAREAVDRADAVLASQESAGALLAVKIVGTTEANKAFVAGDLPRQYSLEAVVEATLTARDGRVLWRDPALRADRQFLAGATVEATEANKQQALLLLASDLGREVMRRVSLTLLIVTPPQ